MQNNSFELLGVLTKHGVPFVVIGGHAVNFHGYIRSTEDVDLVWIRSAESEKALMEALREIHAQWICDEIDPATKLEKTIPVDLAYIKMQHLMILITDLGFLDLFDYVPGNPEADVQKMYDQGIMSKGVRYVSLPWLKQMKQAGERPRDREDLENLGQK